MKYLAVLVMIAGCSSSSVKGVSPSTLEEKVVAKFLIFAANDPDSISFLKWGPHADGIKSGTRIIRVIYRGKNKLGALEVVDALVGYKDGKADSSMVNTEGDDYAEVWRRLHEMLSRPKMPFENVPPPVVLDDKDDIPD